MRVIRDACALGTEGAPKARGVFVEKDEVGGDDSTKQYPPVTPASTSSNRLPRT